MKKEKIIQAHELKVNDLVVIDEVTYYAIDAKYDVEKVLLQSVDGVERKIIDFNDEVTLIFEAERGFEPVIEIKREHTQDFIFPTRKTAKSAGYDFTSPIEIDIDPDVIVVIPTNIKAFMEEDEFLMLSIRSGLSLKGIEMCNAPGIVDMDYYSNVDNDGNIGFILKNSTKKTFKIRKGDRIGQGIFISYKKTHNDTASGERKGGMGSTGV